ITDVHTALMWEKLSWDGSVHDVRNTYTWANAFTAHVATLNAMSFAGHTDWRLPNVRELQSIVNYENVNPAAAPLFSTNCGAGCSVLTSSCAMGSDYWSSTTNADAPALAWFVDFGVGGGVTVNKNSMEFVRAVRGGS